jgi:hypothetical protein
MIVSTSTSNPQQQAGMPPTTALRKALVAAGLTNLVVWSAILYWIGPKADEWVLYVILFAFSFLLALLGLYRGYINKNVPMTSSRHVRAALIWGLLAVVWLPLAFFDRRSQWDIAWKLALVAVYSVKAANHLRKASQPEATKVLPI